MSMATRLELHEKLCELLGSRNVYFQPPESVKLKYPCIVYEFSTADIQYADNKAYRYTPSYDVTLISRDPDIELKDTIPMAFEMCRVNRAYTADNLNHYSYVIYY